MHFRIDIDHPVDGWRKLTTLPAEAPGLRGDLARQQGAREAKRQFCAWRDYFGVARKLRLLEMDGVA